jgi:hypothetical protein
MNSLPDGPKPSPLDAFFASIAEAFAPAAKALREASARFGTFVADHEQELALVLTAIAAFQDEFGIPDNWRDLPKGMQSRLFTIGTKEQLCVVWVPRQAILIELVGAKTPEERWQILMARRAEILEDCETVLSTTPDVRIGRDWEDARLLALKAIAAARDGHDEAAQALASSLVATVFSGVLGKDRLGEVYKEFKKPMDVQEQLLQMRMVVLGGVTVKVLTDTEDILTIGFNRHGTAHGHAEHFGELEMLEAIMFVTAWIREWEFQTISALTIASLADKAKL